MVQKEWALQSQGHTRNFTGQGPSFSPAAEEKDLGALAWVMDPLRTAMETAVKHVRRFSTEAEDALNASSAPLDTTYLRAAHKQLHQACGALHMVGMPEIARLLQSMEELAQRPMHSQEVLAEAAVRALEQASAAVQEYLETILAGHAVSAVALFPQYQQMQALLGNEKTHPADLWRAEIPLQLPPTSVLEHGQPDDAETRKLLEQGVLRLVKAADAEAAAQLQVVCQSLAVATAEQREATFWSLAAGFFDAIAHHILAVDVYVKRATSRVLMHFSASAKTGAQAPQQLMNELQFFCAQAGQPPSTATNLLRVRAAMGLEHYVPADYLNARFARVDPVVLAQARKRIVAAAEAWSALVGGDRSKLHTCAEQFRGVSDALQRLPSDTSALQHALTEAMAHMVQRGEPPNTSVAMEVATSVLYLQAALTTLEYGDARMVAHAQVLAERLQSVQAGEDPQPLESWMEALYRQASDVQTMGSVVGELRGTMDEAEKALDHFFRHPSDVSQLSAVGGALLQMRGVLSVLGLEQAALAMVRMREVVEQLQQGSVEPTEQTRLFERLGNSLGALGFLIDMLGYQRAMASKLFVYDEQRGEFLAVMGRAMAASVGEGRVLPVLLDPLVDGVQQDISQPEVERQSETAVLQEIERPGVAEPEFLPAANEVMQPDQVFGVYSTESADSAIGLLIHDPQGEEDLLAVFLDEAREVIAQGRNALVALKEEPADPEEQITLRRVFHTLKGSARMVGLEALGEAAWAFEHMLNTWLGQSQAVPSSMQQLCSQALDGLADWVDGIHMGAASQWTSELFCTSADAMRLHGDWIPLDFGKSEHPVALEQEGGSGAASLTLREVFVEEAQVWTQQLQTALRAWQLAMQATPLPEATLVWAHGLAGSSATVGASALSTLAHALELALQHVQPWGHSVLPETKQVLTAATDALCELVQQFAAQALMLPAHALETQLGQIVALAGCDSVTVNNSPPADMGREAEPANCSTNGDALALPDAGPARSEAMLAQSPASSAEDDDVVDTIDPDLFPIFEEEGVELLPALGMAMRQLVQQPQDGGARAAVLRVLHTLKGSARLAGAMRLGAMAHRLESAMEAVSFASATKAEIDPLLHRVDALQANFDALRWCGEPGAASPSLEGVPEGVRRDSVPAEPHEERSQHHAVQRPVGEAAAAGASPQQTVRVRSQLLDRLINEAGEVLIARSRLDARMTVVHKALNELGGNLERLRQQLRDLEVQAESQMQSRQVFSKESRSDFDPLEFDRFTRVQELTRMMAESVNDVATVQRSLQREVTEAEDDLVAQGRQAKELQRDLLRTRMVEFDSVAERLYAVVRQAAKETGKQVKLHLEGGTIEVDRGVLERMTPAFEHLLRNCVGHGIELPTKRIATGKQAQGNITVAVQQEGNDVSVAFRDDGAGLQVARIRAKAVELGLITEDEMVDGARAATLIFMPGFSTATHVTGLSGRGIGMDVVRTEVQSLGGRIETETAEGQGSSFRLVLPLTTAVTQVVMLRAGAFSVGVPSNLVEGIRRVQAADLEAAYRSGRFQEGSDALPFYWAGAVWEQSARSGEEAAGRTRPVLVLRSAAQRIALHVDEVLGNQDVVVKHLGPQVARLPGLTGMSVLPSGAVVLIYNPVALTTVYADRIRNLAEQGLASDASDPAAAQRAGPSMLGGTSSPVTPLVMVVDDSITVRRVTQRLLQREGYRVVTAADGQQALERLQDELPCMVLSDIEMPHMDGFDLVRTIRADARWQHLPLVMITSRIADKHREHALSLGANHYLGKPYRDDELMRLVHHYAGQSVQVQATALV